ncbi:MAG: HD domain-containing protein [Deltaproteobacteria bacterium]|jgi:HD-GYP domain-containing protein (c-di-GMP phosphodiesterase class II)|nr:HD domain-containing protein [Deltaproteobacteria bacterium]
MDFQRGQKAAWLAASLTGLVDVDLLLSKILANARQVVRAEAGTVYLVNQGKLRFQTSQNDYLERLIGETEDLPFVGSNLDIDSNTLAGYAALQGRILTVNDTEAIDFDAPFQHLISIDASTQYPCRAIMSIPLIASNDILLGVLQLINPTDGEGQICDFDRGDEAVLANYAKSVSTALERAIMLRDSIINSLKLVELHDQTETTSHAQRIALLTTAIYKSWAHKRQVPQAEMDGVLNVLPLAAMLHDVGKAWIPTHILNKPGRLNKEERQVMEHHVALGAKLYADSKTHLDRLVFQIITDHHERWDGLGYPGLKADGEPADAEPPAGPEAGAPGRGKKGEEISIFGRILAVADVFDALSSRKAYKEPFDESLAVQIMVQESGRHFDPSVIEAFLSVRPLLGKIRARYPEAE